MKKLITLISIVALSIAISIPAMADTNASAGANAGATVEGNDMSSAINGNDMSSNLHIEDNRIYEGTKTHKPKRFFAAPGEINYPGAPGIFGQDSEDATNAYMLMTISDINEYDEDGISTFEAKNMAKGGSKRVMVRSKYGVVDEDQRLPIDANIPVVYKKQEGMKSLGIIVVVSDSKKSIAADVFARVQVEAWKLGGEKLHVKAQGWQRLVRNSGAGIGFTWTGTTISGGQANAMTGVMGAGYAWGEAGYYKHPFIIVHVLAAK
jgi:hypothetical protein